MQDWLRQQDENKSIRVSQRHRRALRQWELFSCACDSSEPCGLLFWWLLITFMEVLPDWGSTLDLKH